MLKSIAFVARPAYGKDKCYQISHDESGTPTLSLLFECPQYTPCTQSGGIFSYELVGSKVYSFQYQYKQCSIDDIFSLDLSSSSAAEWVTTGFKRPLTLGDTIMPGVYGSWLYLIGFSNNGAGLNFTDTSEWGHVYNVDNGYHYALDPPEAFPQFPSPPALLYFAFPQVLGPWKDDGLAVYMREDNTLRVHNPLKKEWKTLVVGIVKMGRRAHSVHLCGNIFYTFHWNTYVLEAYDIVEQMPLPIVRFHPLDDFPELFLPNLLVLSDGMLCFTSLFNGDFHYSYFYIDYGSTEPKPLLTKSMKFHLPRVYMIFQKTFPKLETTT